MASKLIPQAKYDLEIFFEYWGKSFIENFIINFESTFLNNQNYAFTSQTTMLGAGIFNIGYVDFNDNVVSSLKRKPVPEQFIDNTAYLHSIIKGFFDTDEFNDLYKDYKMLLYSAYQSKTLPLYKQVSSKIIGMYLVFLVQEDFSTTPVIEKEDALEKMCLLLEKMSRLDISDYPKVTKRSSILFTIAQLLKYKHSGSKEDYFYFTADIVQKFEDEYKDNYSNIPENTSRQLFELLIKGIQIPETDRFSAATFIDTFNKFWPTFKKNIPYHINGGKSFYSDLGIVRDYAKKYGYLTLADEITYTRMKLLGCEKTLTSSIIERSLIKIWGFVTDYGTSFRRLVFILLSITILTISGSSIHYGTVSDNANATICERIILFKKSLTSPKFYSEVSKSVIKSATMKGDDNLGDTWLTTIIHLGYFIFYTLFIGQIIAFISRYI